MTSPTVQLKGTGPDRRLARTLLVANQKGGVGKSSLITALASMTATPTRRVLVVDADQQANVTVSDLGVQDNDRGRGLAKAIQYGDPLTPVRDIRPGLDLIAGGPMLATVGAAVVTAAQTGIDVRESLSRSLAELCEREEYSLVLIDSGPGDAPLLDTLLAIARYLVVPTKDDDASLAGADMLAKRYLRARRHGSAVQLLGVVLFDANPRATARNGQVLAEIDAMLDGSGTTAFSTAIRSDRAAAVDMRARHLTPAELVDGAKNHARSRLSRLRDGRPAESGERLWSRDPGGLAGDYQRLTREILQRLKEAETADAQASA